jgi:hypothetical protein
MANLHARLWGARFAFARFVVIAAAVSLVLVASRASAGNVPSSATYGATIYALLAADLGGLDASVTSVEVVDAGSMTHIRTVPLGDRIASSLAVSPDEQRLYVADSFAGGIAVLNSSDGSPITGVKLSDPRDLVMSADGSRLYATAGSSIVAIDTATNLPVDSVSTGSDIALGIALSPSGTVLAAVGSDGGLWVADPGNLPGATRVPLSTSGCTIVPGDVTFTDTGRALVWDSNCDRLYQVDVPGQAQVTSDTINLTPDSGGSFNYNNVLSYSLASDRAYVQKESEEIGVLDPAAASGSALGGFSGIPFVPSLTPNGKELLVNVIHRFSGGGADTLDRLDTATGIFTRDVYTFTQADRSVRDMRIVGPAKPIQGDVDCSGAVNAVDALKLLRKNAGLGVSQTEPCPTIGTLSPAFGDVDCSSAVNSIDALKVLRHNAGLEVAQTEPCRNPGLELP